VAQQACCPGVRESKFLSAPDVLIVFAPRYLPFILDETLQDDEKKLESAAILMAAYVAGSCLPQLRTKETRNFAYEGILQMLETYQMLRIGEHIEQFPSLDEWIKLKAAGKLKAHVEQMEKEHEELREKE